MLGILRKLFGCDDCYEAADRELTERLRYLYQKAPFEGKKADWILAEVAKAQAKFRASGR